MKKGSVLFKVHFLSKSIQNLINNLGFGLGLDWH